MLQSSSPQSVVLPWIERRQAMRFPADDAAEIELVGNPCRQLSGFLRDASRTGLRLALPERVSRGAVVKITVRGAWELFGEIQFCRGAGPVYYAGVSIHAGQAAFGAATYSLLAFPIAPPQDGDPQEQGNVRTSLPKL